MAADQHGPLAVPPPLVSTGRARRVAPRANIGHPHATASANYHGAAVLQTAASRVRAPPCVGQGRRSAELLQPRRCGSGQLRRGRRMLPRVPLVRPAVRGSERPQPLSPSTKSSLGRTTPGTTTTRTTKRCGAGAPSIEDDPDHTWTITPRLRPTGGQHETPTTGTGSTTPSYSEYLPYPGPVSRRVAPSTSPTDTLLRGRRGQASNYQVGEPARRKA